MARRNSGGRKKGKGDFVNLTGLWRPREGKSLGIGSITMDEFEEKVQEVLDSGKARVSVFLGKNEYAESRKDPRYYISLLPGDDYKDSDDDDDEDNRGRRRAKKRRPPKSTKSRRSRRDDDEEDDEDLDDDDEEDDEPPF